jgi:small subunit ribosomal protein S20
MRTSTIENARNRSAKSAMQTAIKSVLTSSDKTAAEAALKTAYSVIDKTAKHGVIHPRKAANKKARLAKAAAKIGA